MLKETIKYNAVSESKLNSDNEHDRSASSGRVTPIDGVDFTDYQKSNYMTLIEQAALKQLGNGDHSSAYLLEVDNESKVVRFNKNTDYGFLKDRFAAQHFSSQVVPIPEVFEVGKWEYGDYYAVSEFTHGETLKTLDPESIVSIAPRILEVINAIHDTDISPDGFGWWNPEGKGMHNSWADTLIVLRDLGADPLLGEVDFFEPDFIEQLMNMATELMRLCPEEQKLIHGDLGHNILINDGNVAGVIDWDHSMYGDPLFDIAKLDLHFKEAGFVERYRESYRRRGFEQKYFTERILCYKLLIGISDLVFFVHSSKKNRYLRRKSDLLSIIPNNNSSN